ncbi:MAG: Protein of unknown function (DUF4238) [Rhodobacteraceae bacterium HLUCCO07]|nr:MAG: Protein of unknown function (DUF4238) [Rhodobacteraceae bacterium HLUCCO07]
MSGRKNHHVPQLLQKGFGNEKKKSVQVWVYRKDKLPFPTSTANFGAERDFYIEGEDRLVDDLITEFEGEIGNFIQSMKSGDQQALEDRSTIASILAHLEMRSKFLREEMMFVSNVLFEELRLYLRKPQNMLRYLRSAAANNPEVIQNGIDELGLNDEQRILANAWVEANLDRFLEDNSTQFMAKFQPFLGILIDRLGEAVKGGHLKALRKDVREIGRRKAYLELSYRMVNFEEPGLILPDTMVSFLKRDGRVTPFLENTDTVEEIYLPLTSHKALHGYMRDPACRELNTVNRILASCAGQSFVAQENDVKFRALTSRIGKNAQMISKAELRKVIRTVIPVG